MLLPLCSGHPPQFPGGAREKQNEPEKEGKLTDSCRCWVFGLTFIFSTVDCRLAMMELMCS